MIGSGRRVRNSQSKIRPESRKQKNVINQSHPGLDNSYYGRERPSLYTRVDEGPTIILDLGCGMGTLGRKLRELKKAKELVGAEIFETAGQEAAKFYEKVYIGDIESMQLPYLDYFDYVICGDILEHTKDPYRLVSQIRTWLKPGGKLICSLPNVRNYRVWSKLIFRGQWEYEDSGILDATHLRFFTRKSGCKMVRDAGLQIENCTMLTYGTKKLLLNALTFRLCEELLALQFVIEARKG
jgi:2-polyprenyl-3-methyl-5-hydroxy-6-metoxy-1,4-benzoquinol methylase